MSKIKAPCDYDLPLSGLDYLQWYPQQNVFHVGIDLNKGTGNSDCGNEVKAPAGGFVEFVEDRTSYYWNRGFGKFIIILHDDGTYTRYAHLKDINVKIGDRVKKGDLLGHVGNTGTTYCHLHFECFNNKDLINIQKTHKVLLLNRPWCFYPTGKHKAWVAEHYLNPWDWLKKQEAQAKPTHPEWAKSFVEWATAKGIITKFEGDYMSDYEIAAVSRRLFGAIIDEVNKLK